MMLTCVDEPPTPSQSPPLQLRCLLVEPRGQEAGCQGRRLVSGRPAAGRGASGFQSISPW